MKDKLKIVKILCFLALIFILPGCGKTEVKETAEKVVPVEFAAVPGATLGSTMSSYVINREVWRDCPGLQDRAVGEVKIHVPGFLIDSEDAKAANEVLDILSEEIVTKAHEIAKDLPGRDVDLFLNSAFSVYQDEEILSVYISYNYYMDFQAMIFNFRLSDGKRLRDKDIAELYGIESGYLGMMENSLATEYKSEVNFFESYGYDFGTYHPSHFEGLAFEDLWDYSGPEGERMYLDETGQLRFSLNKYITEGRGTVAITLPLEQEIPFLDRELNPSYIRMANALSRNPYTDNSQAYVLYIGNMFDNLSVLASLNRLYSWQKDFNDFEDVPILLRLDEAADYDPGLKGEETYLVVPKYKHSVVYLASLAPTPEGDLENIFNIYNDNMKVSGTALVCINQGDFFPNSEIVIRYRDEKYSFIPYISMVDSSVVLPDEVFDAEEFLPPYKAVTKKNIKSLKFSQGMYLKIMTFLPID